MADIFDGPPTGVRDPSDQYYAMTPSNTVDEALVTRAIYIGVSGDVAAVRKDGTVVTFKNALAGTILQVRAKRINTTNTTATDIVGLV